MLTGMIGKKLGMTQVFAENGQRIPVTVVQTGPCVVMQKKTVEKDGYEAVQLGFDEQKPQRLNKPMQGHQQKAQKGAFKVLQEIRGQGLDAYEVGQEVVCADLFNQGDVVDVSGKSKGKGFQGVMKRWNFSGGRKTHGSMFHRRPGAIGASAYPARVFKGKKMAGQMGNAKVTSQSLEVVAVRPEDNVVLVKGAVPGPRNGIVTISRGVKGPQAQQEKE